METTLKTTRNLSLECCKLLAACFVVFLHIPFPGVFGQWVVCLSRFAVPLFFAVSGWFSYGASPEKLKRRFRHILLLELTGDLLYVSWRCIRDLLAGESLYWCLRYQLPDLQALKLWLFWSVDPFAGHLWYLSATALCYFVLWVFTRLGKKEYKILYIPGFVLLLCCFAMSEFRNVTGIFVNYWVCRSGIFTGLPVFLMGIFLREHRETLRSWGLPLLIGGIALSVLEWKTFGGYDLYIGSVLTAASLLLLTDRHPNVPQWLTNQASAFGSISTLVYLTHLLVNDIYLGYFQYPTARHFGTAEPWLQPLFILAASMLLAVFWNLLQKRLKK